MKGKVSGDLEKRGGGRGEARLRTNWGAGCNTLSGKWANVVVMTQINCGVAVTWAGPCLAER